MAEMLQKGLNTLSDLFSGQLPVSMTVMPNDPGLFAFVQRFTHLGSKHEEVEFMTKQIQLIKEKINQPSLPLQKMHECLLMLWFCHSVGYDVSFAYLKAIVLAQRGELMYKRAGYVLCSLFFDESSDFSMLLQNTIMKDLRSYSVSTECAALTACCSMVSTVNMSSVIPLIVKKLSHKESIVRKKAIQCLFAFISKHPPVFGQVEREVIECLKDTDPGVLWTVVEIFLIVAKNCPSTHLYLLGPALSMAEGIYEHKLTVVHDYSGVPSPWFLISIVRLLTLLAKDCKESTDRVSALFQKIVKDTQSLPRIMTGLIYEVIRSVSTMPHVDQTTFDSCIKFVGRFLSAEESCLKLNGIRLLTNFVSRDPSATLLHQSTIMECLNSNDSVLREATLTLVHHMANPINKDTVFKTLLGQIGQAQQGVDQKCSMIQKDVFDSALKFSNSDPVWFVEFFFLALERTGRDLKEPTSVLNSFVVFLDKCTSSKVEKARQEAVKISKGKIIGFTEEGAKEQPLLLLAAVLTVSEHYASLKLASSDPLEADDVVHLLVDLLFKAEDSRLRQAVAISLLNLKKEMSTTTCDWLIERLDQLTPPSFDDDYDVPYWQSIQELKAFCTSEIIIDFRDMQESLEKEDDLMFSCHDEYICEYLEKGGSPYFPLNLNYTSIPRLADEKPQDEFMRAEKEDGEEAVPAFSTESYQPMGKQQHPEKKEESFFNGGTEVWTLEGLKMSLIASEKKNDQYASFPINCSNSTADGSNSPTDCSNSSTDCNVSSKKEPSLFDGLYLICAEDPPLYSEPFPSIDSAVGD